MFFDVTYLILVMPAVLFALWASARVKTTFRKYSSVSTRRNLSGAQAARTLLDSNGLQHIRLECIDGELSDHFDPKNQVIRLSREVYNGTSAASIGVATHEVGHAIQHQVGYFPIKIRSAIIPLTNIGSRMAMPLILLGLLFLNYNPNLIALSYAGIACFGLSTLFQLVTLPTEFNASRRALRSMEECAFLYDDELDDAKKVLSAAALTYVAALAVSLMQLFRLLILVSGRRRRDR